MRNVINIMLLLFLLSGAAGCGRSVAVPALSSPLPVAEPGPMSARSFPSPAEELSSPASLSPSSLCGQKLLKSVGKTGPAAEKLPALYQKHSRSRDELFLKYMFAIIYVESSFNRNARSDKDAYGLMQMTEIAVLDAVRHCNLRRIVSMESMYDSATNIRYGTCYLQKAVQELDGDWTQVLIMYNGGYKQLTRYQRGENIVPETANYVLQVQRALQICSNADVAESTNSEEGNK